MMWHRTDPLTARAAVPRLARLCAEGKLGVNEARAALDLPGANRDSKIRLNWALRDNIAAEATRRRRAVWAVRDALAPLLTRRACRQTLQDAAERADPDGVLSPADLRKLVEAETARALARW